MGLAEIKIRRKIDKDPNNTKWLRDTSSFGQKILRAQGWEPGQYLGAKDAAQAEHYTAANASFVRVSLKDDMLGLGFKQSKDEQITGMNAFQDMLARLNGKSDETVAKEKEARVAVQTSLYCDSKFGPMRFVRGGWLVGDTEQDTPVAKLKAEQDAKDQVESKKRKVEEVSDSDSSSEDEKARKKRRKEERRAAKKLKAKSESSTPAEKSDDASASEKDRKKKKSKSKKDSATATEDETDAKSKSKKKSKKSRNDEDLTHSDAEKAAKKEKKRLKKEQKRAAEEASSTTTGTSTPAAAKSGTSTPVLRGHHAVRSKWIKSKSMATMDDAALNQIFMIKAPAAYA